MPAKQDGRKTWQQTKSENTRTVVLDAAVRCFYEQGYANTTTESIATVAGVSRGAMLHHFPTRFELIQATVEHLSKQWLDNYEAQEAGGATGRRLYPNRRRHRRLLAAVEHTHLHRFYRS